MEIKMGEKLRALRRAKGISQEVLAQVLGVSFQAVSKWETDTTLPDISLIPAIAEFYDISTDELFDYNRMEQEKRVMEIVDAAAKLRVDHPAEAEAILRQGLRQYPGNEILLNNLLYTMRAPERAEEVVTLCRSILEITRLDDVKYDVLRILAETYHEMGEQALVMPTLEQIPEIYFTKLELVAELCDGDEAYHAAQLQACIARDSLLEMTAIMSQLKRRAGKTDEAEQFAALCRETDALLGDHLDNGKCGTRQNVWLNEAVWSRLEA